MFLETIATEGLAHLSYVIGDEGAGVCAVIDPRRDVSVYLEIAQQNSARVTHILETHVHADFVSGSRELAAQTGAPIYVGEASEGGPEHGFEHKPLRHRDTLQVGNLCLRALSTPGHTPEHVCYLASGGKGSQEPWALFTGDTLFAGDVGRPDLLGEGTEDRLARQLYSTLYDKVLRLGDGVEIYPAHGQGSPCGGSIGDRQTSTIGYERLHNPKLQARNEDEFVRQVLASLPPAPRYYARMKKLNAAGPPVLGCLPHLAPLGPARFREEMAIRNTVVVDAREIEAFGGAHIEGALNIALRDEFPIWIGWMLEPQERVLLVLTDEADLDVAQRHLLRVGFDDVAGYLRQGMRGWMEAGLPFKRLPQMSVHELKERASDEDDDLQVIDVRRDDEWERGYVPSARHIFAPRLAERLDALSRERPVAVYCGSGYRSSIAASLLEKNGFREVYNVPGSMKAWRAAGYPLERAPLGGAAANGE